MKTKITIALLLLSFTMGVNAQDNELDNREKLQFGAKIGATHSNVYDEKGNEFTANTKFGVAGGIFVMIPIGTYLGIQPEAMITQKGFKGDGSLLGSSYEFKRTTTFLDIPVLVAFKPSEFFTILAGPQYSYLIKQRDDFTSSIISYSQEQEFEQDNIHKNILGFVVGADINIKHSVIGARVAWDIQNNRGDGSSDTPRYKNLCIQLTYGIKLYKED